MSIRISELESIVRHDPRQLRYLFKSPYEDKKRLTKLLAKMLPYRVGVEFEGLGSIVFGLMTERNIDFGNRAKYDKALSNIVKEFRLKDYREDVDRHNLSQSNFNEIRISFNGYHQLISFYNMFPLLKKYCTEPVGGGIHIHIDFSKYNSREQKLKAQEYLKRPEVLNRVKQIFGGYKGDYNKKDVYIETKGSWINLSRLDTIEFRIGSLTYNYDTVIRWILDLTKIVKATENYVKVSKLVPVEEKRSDEANDVINSYTSDYINAINSISYSTNSNGTYTYHIHTDNGSTIWGTN